MKKQLFFLMLFLCVAGITMQAQQRKVLVEEFTASTCGPCTNLNVLLNPWLATNADKMVVIKYQMNWPGAGDPYYTAEGGTRRTYYGVSGVPAVYVNGGVVSSGATYQSWFNNTVNAVNNAYTQPAQATIEGYFRMVGNIIYVKSMVTPLISVDNHFIHVVVNEKTTHNNVGGNGETAFYHVMMKMFPNGNGTTLNLTSGEQVALNFSHDMSTTHVEDMNDLEVAVFVQNKTTRAVLNAEYLIQDNTIPLPPSNFTATQQGESLNINLSWGTVSGASGYNIYKNNVKLNTTPITETTYQDVVAEYGITYNYAIAAVVGGAEGFWTTITALANATLPVPTVTTVKQIRGLQMLVEWEVPETTLPVKFRIYRNNIPLTPPGLTEETSIINTGITYTQYCFQIEPVLNEINGTKSNSVCITLLNIPQPNNFKAEQMSLLSKEVLLTWGGSSSNTAGYNMYRDGVKINTELITGEKTYTDVVSEFNVQYTYQVYGVADTGAESEKCGEVKITLSNTVPPPANVQATQQDNDFNVLVAWDAVTLSGVDGYNIYRDGEKLNTTLVTETEYLDNVLAEGDYCYTITTVVADVISELSEPACVKVKLAVCDPYENAFTLYPNPVSGILNINTNETIMGCQIFNMQGQIIYSAKSNVKEIATDNWASGVYIIRITTEKGSAEKRFSKN